MAYVQLGDDEVTSGVDAAVNYISGKMYSEQTLVFLLGEFFKMYSEQTLVFLLDDLMLPPSLLFLRSGGIAVSRQDPKLGPGLLTLSQPQLCRSLRFLARNFSCLASNPLDCFNVFGKLSFTLTF